MSGLFTKDIVVLDVTSRLLSAIVGVKKAQSVFGIKSVVEKEHPGYCDGEWFDENATLRTAKSVLSEAMKNASSRSKRLFIGVPAEFTATVSREVSVRLDRKRRVVDDDIDFLLNKGNDFSGADFTVINTSAVYFAVDSEDGLYSDVRGMYASGVEACVSYMLAENRFLSAFDKLASELGFTDVRYISTSWAECISLLDEEQRENVYMLVDVGYLSTSVSLAKGEGILDLKSFSLGGGHVAADICEALDVPYDMALDAKKLVDLNLNYSEDEILVGDENSSVPAAVACRIVKNRLDVFADMLLRILDGIKDEAPSYMPVYLTGEGIAPMRGAKKYLGEKLEKGMEILTPKLPGFVRAEDSSKTALLLVADTLSKTGLGAKIKGLFFGGNR